MTTEGDTQAKEVYEQRATMINCAEQIEVRDVEVVAATYFTLRCIIGGRYVGVPSLKTLPGTDVARRGDRGRLVLPRDVAERLGLA